jgi:hypothetical protein
MKKDTFRTLLIVVGVLVLLAMVGLGSAVWLFMRSFDLAQVDEASATQRFDQIRNRFAGVTPVLGIEDETPVVRRRPPAEDTGRRLTTLHVLAWDADDNGLARVDVPFWLLRLKSGPIEIASDTMRFGDGELGITVEELERYGSTLVLDHKGRGGERVLVWTD